MSAAGVAGASDEDRARAFRGEMRYTETRPAAWNAKARLQDMDQDHIDLAVLYPTMLLGLQSERDVDFAEAQARAYNDWCSDHVQEGEGRLFGAGAVPPMHEPDDVARVAAEIRRVAELPGMVSVFMRPNPAVDWRPFNDPVYDPIWQAASDTGLPIALHPFFAPDLPGACQGPSPGPAPLADGSYVDDFDPERALTTEQLIEHPELRPSTLFTQAIANPVDVMSCIAYPLGRRGVRAVPRGEVHLPRGQRGLAGALARAPGPPLPEVPVGGPGPVDAALGVHEAAVLDQLRPRRGHAADDRRVAAGGGRPHHLGVATTRTPTPSSPASPRS